MPNIKKSNVLIISLIAILASIAIAYTLLFSSRFERWYYDYSHENNDVNTEAKIIEILSKLEKVHFSKLPKSFAENGMYNDVKYKALYQHKYFYKLKRDQTLQKIVGKWRVEDFVSRDQTHNYTYFFDNKDIYWITDEKILVAFLKLKHEFEKNDLNWNELFVSSSHRSPGRNKKVKGAPASRHICGDAIDLDVGDINRDGTRNQKDKMKVLELCETLIGNKGGIGLYPGTYRVHIDMRGHYARWNSYKPDI